MILCGFICLASFNSFGQYDKKKQAQSISNKIIFQKNNPSRIELYRLYSDYFVQENVYPNADAIDLVDAYNKEASYDDIKAKRMNFKTLMLLPVPENKIMIRNKQNAMTARNLKIINEQFKRISLQLVQKLPLLIDGFRGISTAFTDSMKMFGNSVLPAIINKSDVIPALQMEYFLSSLNDINNFIDQLLMEDNLNARAAVTEMMGDFFAYQLPGIRKMKVKGKMGYNIVEGTMYQYAAYHPNEEETGLNETDLPNANVYVYTRNANGKWNREPQPDAFNVYYGSNGLYYSLSNGADPLSLFKFHPSQPASPLPVILPKGNICFVFENLQTHKITVKPGIRLRDNTEVDDKQLIKLCFKIEN